MAKAALKFYGKILVLALLVSAAAKCNYQAGCSASDLRCDPLLSSVLFMRNTCATQGYCKMFATAGTWFGDLGGAPGVSGADSRCNADANKPTGGGTYSALISDGSTRIASVTANVGDGQVGWVMLPNMEYRNASGATVWTTNSSGLFVFGTLTNQITSGGTYFTGMDTLWVSNATCLAWTDGTGANQGRYGVGGTTTSTALALTQTACNVAQRGLYCVQR